MTQDSPDLQPECPICHEPLAGSLEIRCPLCRSAHHLHCYADAGGCGVFRCDGPGALLPKPQQARSEDELTEELFRAEVRHAIQHLEWDELALVYFILLLCTLGSVLLFNWAT